MTRLAQIPPWVWVAVTAVAGVGVLAYHRYAQDDTDTDWTTAKESQPPMRAPYPDTPAAHGEGRPMETGVGFRQRSYPGTLADADFSIIGEF